MQEYEKKAKEAKNYTQALREVRCAYTKKNNFRLEGKTAILERPSEFQIMASCSEKKN